MPTYGRHRGRGTATAYPVACAICGSLFPRKRMRYDGQGQLVCPDEGRGHDAATLDRLNSNVRPLRQKGPSDGLADVTIRNPKSILGTSIHSWFRPELGEFDERGEYVTRLRNVVDGGDAALSRSAPRPGVRWVTQSAIGRSAFLGSTGEWLLDSSALSSNALSLPQGRPYIWAVAATSAATVAADSYLFRYSGGGLTQVGLRIRTVGPNTTYNAYMNTTLGTDHVTGPAVDDGPHLFEIGFKAAATGRFVVDGVSYDGTSTLGTGAECTRLLFGGSSGAHGWPGPFAELVVASSLPSAGAVDRMREYFSSRYPDLDIA